MSGVNLKKRIMIVPVLALLFCGCVALSACDNRTAWTDIENIKNITIGVADNYEPFSSPNQNGDLVGFDVEFLSLLSKKIGVKIKIKALVWEQAEERLNDKTVDALWNFSRTDGRAERVLFSDAYMRDKAAIVAAVQDVAGQDLLTVANKIAVQKVSTQDEWMSKSDFASKAVYCANFAETMQQVENGAVDCAVVDLAFAKYYLAVMASATSPKLAIVDDNLYDITYNAAVRKTDVPLAEKLNKGIAAVCQDEAFIMLCDKWFDPII